MAAMVNMNSLLSGKDSRWLQLEVCREFQRNKCSRQDTECKFAHPPANVEVQNGKVTACYDSIKGRCNRDKPPCKYFHPPLHLKDQLLINGRNHLALKNALMQQMGIAPGQPVMPGQVPAVATSPYLTGIPANTYSPYFAPGHLVPALLGPDPSAVSQLGPVVPQAVQVAQQKIPRADRLEVCREFMRGACKRPESECRFAHPQDSVTTHEDGFITVCMDAVKGRCAREPCRYFHPPLHLQAQIKAAQSRAALAATAPVSVSAGTLTHSMPGIAHPHPPPSSNTVAAHPLEVGKKRAAESDLLQMMDVKTVGSFYYENFAFSGMVPYKRPAAEKSGIPVYQPGATTYQQLMQLQQPPFVPVSCEYQSQNAPTNSSNTTASKYAATTAYPPPPPPQTSITITTTTTATTTTNTATTTNTNTTTTNSATTLVNMSSLYATNNNLQLTLSQNSPNFPTSLINRSHYAYNLVNSSGNGNGNNNSNSNSYSNSNSNNIASNLIGNNFHNYNTNNNNNNNSSNTSSSNNSTNTSNNFNSSAIMILDTSKSLTHPATTATPAIATITTNTTNTNTNTVTTTTTTTTPSTTNPFKLNIDNNLSTSNTNDDNNNDQNGTINGQESLVLTNNSVSETTDNVPSAATNDPDLSPEPIQYTNANYNSHENSTANGMTTPIISVSTYPNDGGRGGIDEGPYALRMNLNNHRNGITQITTTTTPTTTPATGLTTLPPASTTFSSSILPTPAQAPSQISISAPPKMLQTQNRLHNSHGSSAYANTALVPNYGYTPSTNPYQSIAHQPSSQSLTICAPYGNAASVASSLPYSYAYSPHQYAQSSAAVSNGTIIGTAYHDAASLAKEVAQKNYANAVKMAAASNALSNKTVSAGASLNYTGMALNKSATYMAAPQQTASAVAAQAAMAMAAATHPHHHAALIQAQQQQAQVQAQQVQAAHAQAAAAAAAAQMRSIGSLPGSGMSTPVGTPIHTPAAPTLLQRPASAYLQTAPNTALLRSQTIPLTATAQTLNPASNYAAAATAAANQQYAAALQQSFFYPGLLTGGSNYSYAAMGATAQAMPGVLNLPAMAQMAAQNSTAAGSAVVLNPYKKMKTS